MIFGYKFVKIMIEISFDSCNEMIGSNRKRKFHYRQRSTLPFFLLAQFLCRIHSQSLIFFLLHKPLILIGNFCIQGRNGCNKFKSNVNIDYPDRGLLHPIYNHRKDMSNNANILIFLRAFHIFETNVNAMK